MFGGAILNATISMYAYASIEPLNNGKVEFQALDRKESQVLDATEALETDPLLILHKGVYNRIVKQYAKKPLSFRLTTFVDAPPGSGLGTSSTLVVAILGAFAEWLNLPLGEYDLAQLAFDIERVDLKMDGGKQDQYAATFGGVNFMEFHKDKTVIVNPLRVRDEYMEELAHNLLLYYTETSRISSDIIRSQKKNVTGNQAESIAAMHHLKEQAVMMKEALLRGHLDRIGDILDFGWQNKKKLTEGVTNSLINDIYAKATRSGATGGKISGAGGGGFMIFYCPGNTRYQVIDALAEFGGRHRRYAFTRQGLTAWKSGN
jgi:D-glycero-alpha-D-manno-heptose-7-phosphate kinase